MISKFYKSPLLIYFPLSMFYIFSSGLPQIADALIVFLTIYSLSLGNLKIVGGEIWFFFFLIYSIIVNTVWAVYLGKFQLWAPSVYFLFNGLAFILYRHFFLTDIDNIKFALRSIILALCIQLVFVLIFTDSNGRSTGTFNNPNQLAYFSVIFTSMGLFLCSYLNLRFLIFLAVLLLGWVLVLHSLSKAGIGAFLIFSMLVLIRLGPLKILSLITLFLGVILFVEVPLTESAFDRMASIGEDKDDSLAGRGYDRIFTEIQYVFFGAGEGDYQRHNSLWAGEIHSTFGTLLFCYGLVGLLLLSMFIYKTVYVRIGLINFLAYLIPVFAYSVTHNGLRFTPFWILLALLSVCGNEKKIIRKN